MLMVLMFVVVGHVVDSGVVVYGVVVVICEYDGVGCVFGVAGVGVGMYGVVVLMVCVLVVCVGGGVVGVAVVGVGCFIGIAVAAVVVVCVGVVAVVYDAGVVFDGCGSGGVVEVW